MDIMRPRVWRACGWTATALFGGVTALSFKILRDGRHADTGYLPVLNVMIAACALLAGIRLIAPPLAKLHQEFQLNLGLQRKILDPIAGAPAAAAGPPSLKLVRNPGPAAPVDDRHSNAG